MRRILCLFTVLFLFGSVPNLHAALTPERQEAMLDFTKDFIMKESKDSGIFSLKHPETGAEEWFELYGILGNVAEQPDGSYMVTVDVDLFGYPDRNYLLYFVVREQGASFGLEEIRIGPRFIRKDSQKLSIPE